MKKVVIIVSIIVVLLGALIGSFFIFGGKFLKLEVKDIPTQINYKDGDFVLPDAVCKFFDKELTNDKVKITKSLDLSKIGEQEVEYTCKHISFTVTKTVKYTIVDKKPPVITLNGDSKVTITVGDKYEDKGAKATDNADGDITASITKEGTVDTKKTGKYEIVYKVKDASGNEASVTRTVIVKAKTATVKKVATGGGKTNLTCGKAGTIYLTFDDGPNGVYTPVILNVLKKYNVKATFFVTNSGPDSLIKREANEGHVVAIHSASHAYNKIYVSSEAFWKDMNSVSNRIERLTGKKPDLLRFPGGSSNTVSRRYKLGIMTQLAKEVEDRGYAYFDWNISSGDAGETTNPSKEVRNVTSNLSKSRGNVILMHDIKKHTSLAIEDIVKYGLNKGYSFDVLDKSISCHQRIAN